MRPITGVGLALLAVATVHPVFPTSVLAQHRPRVTPRAMRDSVSSGNGASQVPRAAAVAFGPSRETVRKRGEATFNDYIATSGKAHDSVWDSRLDAMVKRLSQATGVPSFDVTWALINDATPNAVALPGGFFVVNRGMLRFVDSVAQRLEPSDAIMRDRRATGMLAAVVSHELAHLTLGHGDSSVMTGQRLTSPRTSSAAMPRAMAGVDKNVLAQQRAVRADEEAADKTGALYLVRASFEIEGALDLMRALDAVERAHESSRRSLDDFTWLRGHPRAAARLATLEAYRARLRARQADLDDALTLLASDAEPSLAIELLDSVLTDFPTLAAARHGRAVAKQQEYIALVSVNTLKVRPSTPVFSSEFLLSVRGDSRAAAALLAGAREDYERALTIDVHPYTLSTLAVLDAWGGDSTRARERAERALRDAPNDADVLNNLGVVRYLAGDGKGARAAFESGVRVAGDSVPPRLLFNYARTLIDARDPEGRRVMDEYLLRDDKSAWAALGRTLMGGAGAPAPPNVSSISHAPSTPGDTTSPRVLGIALGALPADVVTALGEPPQPELQRGRSVWHYPDRGVSLVLTPRDGVLSIILDGNPNESVAGLHVGDSMSAVHDKLGEPSEVVRDRYTFARKSWMIVVDRAFGLVSRIALQRP